MKILYLFILSTFILSSEVHALSADHARHFQRRVGYHVDSEFQKSLLKMTNKQAVDHVLSRIKTTALNPSRKWVKKLEEIYLLIIKAKRGFLSKEEKKRIPLLAKNIIDMFPKIPKALKRKFNQNLTDPKKLRRSLNMLTNKILSRDLQAWWLEEMILTDSPLTERMTLFWHNHFATSYRKVKVLPWVYKQNIILRRHALGNFKDLLKAISTDAAMLWYLDSNKNVKDAPNENFAREVMELFTLGEGNYSEKDIKEAARAFTGWDFDRLTGKFILRIKKHDTGIKNILGRKGNFHGDQVLDILLKNKKTAIFITSKIWREFISPSPKVDKVNIIADKFYKSGYEIKVLLREIFATDEFYSSFGNLIKSPTDLLIGTLKQFNIDPITLIPYAVASGRLGQELFNPPNVKGWPGGKKWINTATYLTRKDILSRIFRVGQRKSKEKINIMKNPMKMMSSMSAIDMEAWLGENDKSSMLKIILPIKNVNTLKKKKKLLAWTRQLVLDPAYQLR
ncbi:MAG: DUF1800 domain-containing protein [Bacteriovoracaceae bacterium]|jgi:uncharacterized protein (DUF1800 family)|nr:DUF1800 domain-containing protein [Bacteriovoracaceae bacterium]